MHFLAWDSESKNGKKKTIIARIKLKTKKEPEPEEKSVRKLLAVWGPNAPAEERVLYRQSNNQQIRQ